MTKNERIAALEKAVAELSDRAARQDTIITALIAAQVPKAPEWRYPSVWPSGPYIPFSYDPNTSDAARLVKPAYISGDPFGSVGAGSITN